MIEDAIITIGERKGSSRQAIWKYVNAKYSAADYKQFLIRLRKEAKEGHVLHIKGRFKVDVQKKKALLKKGAKQVAKTGATTK